MSEVPNSTPDRHSAECKCLQCAAQRAAVTSNELRLLPCPFCGTNAELNTATNDHTWWTLGCPNVLCHISPQAQSQDRDEMVAAWNKRNAHETSAPQLEPTRETLQKLVQQTASHWLGLQCTHPIPWEGAIDGAMEAACNEIRRLSSAQKARPPQGCKNCPWDKGDTYQRDCAYPDCSPAPASGENGGVKADV